MRCLKGKQIQTWYYVLTNFQMQQRVGSKWWRVRSALVVVSLMFDKHSLFKFWVKMKDTQDESLLWDHILQLMQNKALPGKLQRKKKYWRLILTRGRISVKSQVFIRNLWVEAVRSSSWSCRPLSLTWSFNTATLQRKQQCRHFLHRGYTDLLNLCLVWKL